jgi:predicted metal-dependent phosphoesterase TrpH
MKSDLHLHSNCSDGSDTVKELAENIIKSGVKIFALTDHDTVEGCEEMKGLIPDDIKFIPSIELTCKAGSIKCHILGYNCDYKSPALLELIRKGKELRRKKLETRIQYLKDTWNITLTQKELDWLYARKSVVKTHIANVLVNRGLAKDNLSAMKKYLDGCKAGDTRFTGEEAIQAIIRAGGIPVWAHPLGGEGEEHLSEEEFLSQLEQMKQFGIKGLECYYSRYSLEEVDFLVKCANEHNLYITGGSDYHGSNKGNITIGKLNTENIDIDANKLNILGKI